MFDDARPRKRQRLQSQPASISLVEQRIDERLGNSAQLQGQARCQTSHAKLRQITWTCQPTYMISALVRHESEILPSANHIFRLRCTAQFMSRYESVM